LFLPVDVFGVLTRRVIPKVIGLRLRIRDTQYRTIQKAILLEVVDDLVSSVKSHTGRISELGLTRIVRYSRLLL
jgi:hypothetical protein